MVESIIGIRGKDFILLAQDANTTKYGILNMKFDTNRLFKLSEHCAMLAGETLGPPPNSDVSHDSFSWRAR